MTTKWIHSIDSSTPETPNKEDHENVGIIVGRFQTPYLHEGHKNLIDQVVAKHGQVAIFLGISPNKRSRRDPLDYEARRLMIKESYPHVAVYPLSDTKDDLTWSKALDAKIAEVYTFATKRLYGGRDSFIAHYLGSLPTTEIEPVVYHSATSLRNAAGHDIRNSADWRAGVIYGAYNQWPKTWQTIDLAPVRWGLDGKYEILLARKPNEEAWRFIGGFVDPTDVSLEMAVRREAAEEAHIGVDGLEYVCSARIDDWRYKDDVDKVVTTVFVANYVTGAPQPDDDIEELSWFHRDRNAVRSLNKVSIVEAHKEIFDKVLTYLERKYAKEFEGKFTPSVR